MAYNGVADLNNSGNIISTAKGLYEAYAIGITTQWYINGLTNSGNITVEAEAGSSAYAGGIMSFEITDLTNSGNITVSAEGYAAFAEGISGLFIDGLTNSGTIKAEAICKEPMFLQESGAFAMGIGGTGGIETYIGGAVFTDIVNTGIINASVTTEAVDVGGMAVGIIGSGISSGDGLADGETSTITNEGLILVQGTAPEGTDPEYLRLAGIVITGGDDVVISNPGEIRVESSVDGVEARTLVVTGGASVTIDDSFAITFGSPGVGPGMRPIYVESGTLDLNGATLIVRADSRNLQLDTEYYIVENAEGIVEGEWASELERGYANESIEVNWVDDEDLGENAGVIFSYNPEAADPEDVLAPGMGGLTGTPIIVDSIVQQINPYSPLNVNTLLVKDERKSVLLASNGVSDEGLPGLGATSRYRGFWFMPVYTRLVGDDIGYDANAYGLALGIGGKVSEAGYIGGYAGYAKGFLDFNIDSGDTEEQNIFFGGLSGVYGPMPWYVRFSGVGYYADHSYEGYTGLLYDLDEEAEYNGIGCNIEVAVGGSFGDSVRFVPEAGLAYQYGSIDKFETEVDADPSWEREIEPEDINVLKGILGMSVIGGVGSPTQFYFGARLEYALSDNDVSAVNALIGGTEFDIERKMDDSLLSVTAGLNHDFGNNWSLEFGLRGDLSDDYNAYTGRMFIRKSF